MGKPRDIGIRENSVNQLTLAKEMILEHIIGDSNLEIACTLIKTTITHLELFPNECEFKDGCYEEFENNTDLVDLENYEPMRDESRD